MQQYDTRALLTSKVERTYREDPGRIAAVDPRQRPVLLKLHLVPAVVVCQHLQRPVSCLRDCGTFP